MHVSHACQSPGPQETVGLMRWYMSCADMPKASPQVGRALKLRPVIIACIRCRTGMLYPLPYVHIQRTISVTVGCLKVCYRTTCTICILSSLLSTARRSSVEWKTTLIAAIQGFSVLWSLCRRSSWQPCQAGLMTTVLIILLCASVRAGRWFGLVIRRL